jgi:hypothetical protein
VSYGLLVVENKRGRSVYFPHRIIFVALLLRTEIALTNPCTGDAVLYKND